MNQIPCNISKHIANMENTKLSFILYILFTTFTITVCESQLQTYIIHVQPPKATVQSTTFTKETYYNSFLPTTQTKTSTTTKSRIIHSYTEVITGFAARLTNEELASISKKQGFLHSYPDRVYKLKTTHTSNFLGLNLRNGVWQKSLMGKGTIIGVLDGGVAPNHPSFSGKGMPPPPKKWKGKCEFSNPSLCNNKLIGARSFFAGAASIANSTVTGLTPDDLDGHGTHTASTAAGAFVPYADVLGNAKGTASGMAPYAHVAVYKVCGFSSVEDCVASDILAGMDAAIADGVDVMSLSLGSDSLPFDQDTVAIGGFHAISKGIFVSTAAGNSGPVASTLSNEAPWLLTVGASTMDRTIKACVNLGNGLKFAGESISVYQKNKPSFSALVYAGASKIAGAAFCANGTLNERDVKGKVVLCDRGGGVGRIEKGDVVKSAGGVAMILANSQLEGFSTLADVHSLPASHISFFDGLKIKRYINSTTTPMGSIDFEGTVLGANAPEVTSFSSRGPSLASPGILKPDIIGPGVNVLAAWPFSPSPLESNKSNTFFNVISGTSMSTPHLSGIAALVKSVHPDWSSAAVKSAIMTTADEYDRSGKAILDERHLEADLYTIGSGHVNAMKAISPGLVYDLKADDYIPYLCGLGYSDTQIETIVGHSQKCVNVKNVTERELNYPSISISFGSKIHSVSLTRTVKNVGEANAVYWVKVDAPKGVTVDVQPKRLQFYKVGQEMKYTATFKRYGEYQSKDVRRGNLKWVNKMYNVRSPISVVFGS